MTKSISAQRILDKINCPFLSLFKGPGYWYFVYDAPLYNVFETKSVYTMYLKDLPMETWVAVGEELVALGDAARKENTHLVIDKALAAVREEN